MAATARGHSVGEISGRRQPLRTSCSNITEPSTPATMAAVLELPPLLELFPECFDTIHVTSVSLFVLDVCTLKDKAHHSDSYAMEAVIKQRRLVEHLVEFRNALREIGYASISPLSTVNAVTRGDYIIAWWNNVTNLDLCPF